MLIQTQQGNYANLIAQHIIIRSAPNGDKNGYVLTLSDGQAIAWSTTKESLIPIMEAIVREFTTGLKTHYPEYESLEG